MPEPKTARQEIVLEANALPPHGAQSPLTVQVRPPLPQVSAQSTVSFIPRSLRLTVGSPAPRLRGARAPVRPDVDPGARRRRRGGAGAGRGRGLRRHRVCRALGQPRKHRWSGAAEQDCRVPSGFNSSLEARGIHPSCSVLLQEPGQIPRSSISGSKGDLRPTTGYSGESTAHSFTPPFSEQVVQSSKHLRR